MLWDTGAKKADFTVTSDASGSWGCGAFCMVPFSVVGQTSSLVYRYKGDDTNSGGCSYLWEGVVYQNCRISCGQHGSSTHSQCHFLLRWSFDALNQASSVFRVMPQFLVLCLPHRRRVNTIADALSRNNLQRFFSQDPPAPCSPAAVP